MGIVFSTVNDIVTAAMQELGLLRVGASPTASEALTGMQRFNLMLDELSVGKDDIFIEANEPFTLQAGVNGYTIGTGGTFNTTRPTEPTQAFITIGTANYPVDVTMTEDEYYGIPQPSQSTRPTRLWFKPDYPLASIYFDVVPDQAYAFTLISQKPFTKATDPSDALNYPDGYEAMFVPNLAKRMAPLYGKTVPAETQERAVLTLQTLERINAVRQMQVAQFSEVPGRTKRRGNIYDMGYTGGGNNV